MILVTGATGHIGRELVQQLIEAGQPTRVFVRDERKVAHLAAQVERAVGDLSKPETLTAAMQGVDRIFLVTFETQQDINTLEAAKRAGVAHVVKLSTLEALMELADTIRKNKGAQLTNTVEQVVGRPAQTFETWRRENIGAFQ